MRGPWVPPWIAPLPDRPEPAGRILFVSDMHFGSGLDDKSRRAEFVALLSELQGNVDDLVVGGDAFEFWWERNGAVPARFLDVLDSLRSASDAGIRLRFVAGNHDFAIGQALADHCRAEVHPDGFCLESSGHRWLLVHGDAAPASEGGDRIVRRLLRSSWAQAAWNLLPGDLGFRLALGVGDLSRRVEPGPAPSTIEMEPLARSWMETFGLAGVIHGHTHRPFLTRTAGGTYVNNGDWTRRRTAVWIEGDRADLIDFTREERPWRSNT